MTARQPWDRPSAHDVMTRLLEPAAAPAPRGPAPAMTDAARRAASAAIATEAMPVATTAGSPAVVSAPAAGARRSTGSASELAHLAPAVRAAASAPERAAAARRVRARRRRLALAAGAVSTAAVAGIITASVLLWHPPTTPTTDRVESPAVQVPRTAPSDETPDGE